VTTYLLATFRVVTFNKFLVIVLVLIILWLTRARLRLFAVMVCLTDV